MQANVDANVARQSELLVVINKSTAVYRQAFGFREWRQACEVCLPISDTHVHSRACFCIFKMATSYSRQMSLANSAEKKCCILCHVAEVLRAWTAELADTQLTAALDYCCSPPPASPSINHQHDSCRSTRAETCPVLCKCFKQTVSTCSSIVQQCSISCDLCA